MVKLEVCDNTLGVCYIQINDGETDEFIAQALGIKDYVTILKEYGAYQPYCSEYYFKSKIDAQKCVDHLNNNQVYKEYYESEEADARSKPPLGVMPRNLFERQRVQELSRALYEYIDAGNKDYDMLVKWSEELQDRLWNLKCDTEENI